MGQLLLESVWLSLREGPAPLARGENVSFPLRTRAPGSGRLTLLGLLLCIAFHWADIRYEFSFNGLEKSLQNSTEIVAILRYQQGCR